MQQDDNVRILRAGVDDRESQRAPLEGVQRPPTVDAMTALPHHKRPFLLELDLTQMPVEQEPDDPISRLRNRGRHLSRHSSRIARGGEDPRVVGLIAKVGGSLPWAGMQELRLGVRAFAAGGKPTLAWAETFGEEAGGMAGYVLATAFDEVWIQPGGDLGLLGVGVETTFLRGALDRLGIEPQLEQRHEFKNAADQVMRTEFTQAHRIALERLAESVFTEAVEAIAQGRGLDPAVVRGLVDGGPHLAEQARNANLVDALGYRDQAHAAMRARVGGDVELLFADQWRPRRRPRLPRRHRGHVALVEVRGAIASGRSRRGPMGRTAGSDSVGAALRAAAADDNVRAVVLHVDSPGGSAVASETIWREVVLLRAAKPVDRRDGRGRGVGRLLRRLPGQRHRRSTLDADRVDRRLRRQGGRARLLDRVGLTTGSVSSGEHALMFSARRGFDDAERERLAAAIDAVYDDFVAKVAEGRGRPVPEIEAVARGRVWELGRDAIRVGLADELGGLRHAVPIARTRAHLPDDAPVLHDSSCPPTREAATATEQ